MFLQPCFTVTTSGTFRNWHRWLPEAIFYFFMVLWSVIWDAESIFSFRISFFDSYLVLWDIAITVITFWYTSFNFLISYVASDHLFLKSPSNLRANARNWSYCDIHFNSRHRRTVVMFSTTCYYSLLWKSIFFYVFFNLRANARNFQINPQLLVNSGSVISSSFN